MRIIIILPSGPIFEGLNIDDLATNDEGSNAEFPVF